MTKKHQILVIGHDDSGCTDSHRKIAYDVGHTAANAGCVLITGGKGGIMREASHGAVDAGGLTVGILPQNNSSDANEFCQIVIPSGMGLMRDFLNALSADGIVIIGGGAGTLSEVCAAYMHKKPMVAIRGTGGVADQYADQYMDHRKHVKIIGVDTPKQAINKILKLVNNATNQ